ncbi:GntR family transcriptional regulator [Macrococcus bovicus]|uniref:GntR family transcriptional regulator n=1 Tax=Macrococcus bovicus TaxID=69968 RepID=UPI0025A5FBC7|nr:GntR family transcriptional regulator [Macrococcus bovicus]WJP97250.1 GntR family transcriptional regulator [Macrococcus bovicus]
MKKYEQIVEDIEAYIHDNELAQGTRLSSVESYAAHYQVSKSTIIKAMDILEKKGAIFQQRGSGVFVRRQRRKGYVSLLTNRGFTEELKDFAVTTQLLKLELMKPTEEVMLNLKLSEEDEVYYVERLRDIDGNRLCIEASYFPKKIVTYLNNEIAEGSIFNYLTEGLKLNISFADIYLHVDTLNEEQGEKLQLHAGAPALFVEQVVYLGTGEPFDYSKLTYHYQHSKFFVQAINF